MSNNTNTPSSSAHQPASWVPVTEASFMNGLHAESSIWLTDARWDTIDAPEKAVRVRRGLDLATSDVTGLDELALRTRIDTAEPSMWWAETKLGD